MLELKKGSSISLLSKVKRRVAGFEFLKCNIKSVIGPSYINFVAFDLVGNYTFVGLRTSSTATYAARAVAPFLMSVYSYFNGQRELDEKFRLTRRLRQDGMGGCILRRIADRGEGPAMGNPPTPSRLRKSAASHDTLGRRHAEARLRRGYSGSVRERAGAAGRGCGLHHKTGGSKMNPWTPSRKSWTRSWASGNRKSRGRCVRSYLK